MSDENQFPLKYVRHSETSYVAAVENLPHRGTKRWFVLECLRDAYPGGHTDDEMQALLKMNPNTQRPRRRELEEVGLVEDSGQKRPTISGTQAVVWRVVVHTGNPAPASQATQETPKAAPLKRDKYFDDIP